MQSPSDCRIVIISSSTSLSRDIANRIKSLSGDTSTYHDDTEHVPWTISNKYYTADVHFHAVHVDELCSAELNGVPALIYAWNGNEPYRERVKQMSRHIKSLDFDVSLAISSKHVQHDDLEVFFSEHGFEYINGDPGVDPRHGITDDLATANPGLHRAVDALSTIMWPSMVRKVPSRLGQTVSKTSPRALDEADLMLQALIADAQQRGGADNRSARLKKEMEELERWLDDTDEQKPLTLGEEWTVDNSTGTAVSRPISKTSAAGEIFDDDFAEFVSGSSADDDGQYFTLQEDTEPDPVSDLLKEEDDDDDDADNTCLPSQSEVKAAAERIYGSPCPPAPRTSNPSVSSRSSITHADAARENELDSAFDSPAFDLSRIFGALQNMKEEIAGIEDEQERRRAAARVALGLVYGLEVHGSDADLEYTP